MCALLGIDEAEIVERTGVVGFVLERLLQLLDALVVFTLGVQRVSQRSEPKA